MTRGLGSALVVALLVPTVVGCSSGPEGAPPEVTQREATDAAPEASAPELAEPRRFRTRLESTRAARPDGLVDWRSDWVLTWAEVPGARGYTVSFATSEGDGGRERSVEVPELTLDVAAGTSPARRVRADRDAQVTLTASQLLVSVRATGPEGAEGPASPWYRVGEVPPDGVPVPNPSTEAH